MARRARRSAAPALRARSRRTVVDTDGRTPERGRRRGRWPRLGDAPVSAATTRIAGRAATAPYDVVVGHGLLGELAGSARRGTSRGSPSSTRRRSPPATARPRVDDAAPAGVGRRGCEVPDAEEAKTAEVAAALLGRARAGRLHPHRRRRRRRRRRGRPTWPASSPRPGCAACASCRCPTTLLGMVDAAVGGKTGINTAEGKNLVGAFHPPAGVLVRPRRAGTLPRGDSVAGWPRWSSAASSPTRRSSTSSRPTRPAQRGPAGRRCASSIERAIRSRPTVVAEDLRESARVGREILNYGHTLGHADRAGRALPLAARRRGLRRHGLRRRARPAGRPARRRRRRPAPRRVLDALGLPTTYRGDRGPSCSTAMRVDKKARGDLLRFVVLDGAGQPRPASRAPTRPCSHAAYAEVATGGVHDADVLVLNGPNLGRLGTREPEVYGADDLRRPRRRSCRAARARRSASRSRSGRPTTRPSWSAGCTRPPTPATPVRAQPGGLHPLLLRAARRLRPARPRPLVEVHISNPAAREEFRHTSVVAAVADRHDRRVRPRAPTCSRCAPSLAAAVASA